MSLCVDAFLEKLIFEGDSIAPLFTCKNMMIAEDWHWKCMGAKESKKGREKLYRLFSVLACFCHPLLWPQPFHAWKPFVQQARLRISVIWNLPADAAFHTVHIFYMFFFFKQFSLCPTSFFRSGRDNLDFLTLSSVLSIFVFWNLRKKARIEWNKLFQQTCVLCPSFPTFPSQKALLEWILPSFFFPLLCVFFCHEYWLWFFFFLIFLPPFHYADLPLGSSLYSGSTVCTEADGWLLTDYWGWRAMTLSLHRLSSGKCRSLAEVNETGLEQDLGSATCFQDAGSVV